MAPKQVLLFCMLLGCYTYFLPRWGDWNANSRFDLTRALVDDHSMAIDRYVSNTGDYAVFESHYYSDKAPGLALVGVPVYAVFEALVPPDTSTGLLFLAQRGTLNATLRGSGSGMESDRLYTFVALAATTFVVGAVPAALLGVLFFNVGAAFGMEERGRWLGTLLYALATSAFAYANSFVSHQFTASLLFAAFALLLRIKCEGLSRLWLVGVGFLLGYSTITEYPTALIGALLGLYALTLGRPLAGLTSLMLGALPPVVLLALHDYAAFGTILPVGYLHSALYQDVHSNGLVGITHPRLDTLWAITFGPYRGLFFHSPYLLFAIAGFVWLWKRSRDRPAFWVLLLAPVSFVLFNSSVAVEQGGFAVGPRYVVPSLPFLSIAASAGLVLAWRRPLLRPLVAAAAAWSFFAVWAETIAGQSFPDYTPNPLFNLSLPLLAAGDVARNIGMGLGLPGLASIVPLVVFVLIANGLALAFLLSSGRSRTQEAA